MANILANIKNSAFGRPLNLHHFCTVCWFTKTETFVFENQHIQPKPQAISKLQKSLTLFKITGVLSFVILALSSLTRSLQSRPIKWQICVFTIQILYTKASRKCTWKVHTVAYISSENAIELQTQDCLKNRLTITLQYLPGLWGSLRCNFLQTRQSSLTL